MSNAAVSTFFILHFVARHSSTRCTQNTLRVLTLFVMNTTFTTDIMCTTLRATAIVKYSERDARENDAHQNAALEEQVKKAM
jgi:hypothetical protein